MNADLYKAFQKTEDRYELIIPRPQRLNKMIRHWSINLVLTTGLLIASILTPLSIFWIILSAILVVWSIWAIQWWIQVRVSYTYWQKEQEIITSLTQKIDIDKIESLIMKDKKQLLL